MFYTEEMLAGSTLEDFTPFMGIEEDQDDAHFESDLNDREESRQQHEAQYFSQLGGN